MINDDKKKVRLTQLDQVILTAANNFSLFHVKKRLITEGKVKERTFYHRQRKLVRGGLLTKQQALTETGKVVFVELQKLQSKEKKSLVTTHNLWFKVRVIARPSDKRLIKLGWNKRKFTNTGQMDFKIDVYYKLVGNTLTIHIPNISGESPNENEITALETAHKVLDSLGSSWTFGSLKFTKPPHHVLNPLKPVGEYLYQNGGHKAVGDLIVDNSFRCGGEFENGNWNAEEFFRGYSYLT